MSLVKPEMMMRCFDVILNKLVKYPLSNSEFDTTLKYGIFVTFKKFNHGEYDLRGCIGYLSPISISDIDRYAISSAFKDYRFDPISIEEVSSLRCTVSLLHSFTKQKSCFDWIVGKHGIIIEFEEDGEYYRATYLPEVAKEQDWDVKTTLRHLIQKSGYRQKPDAELFNRIELTTYETQLASLTFDEYVKMTQERNRDIIEFCKNKGLQL
ncbi:hypothetical protein WA158_006806 [Blastocystis sp. Blastoise]